MAYLEYGHHLPKGTFYYEDKIFAKIAKLKINDYAAGAAIIAVEFEEFSLTSKALEGLATYMIRYAEAHANDKGRLGANQDLAGADQENAVKNFKYKELKYYDRLYETITMDEIQVLK